MKKDLGTFQLITTAKASPFSSLRWSPKARVLATAGKDGVVWLWRPSDDSSRRLEAHSAPVSRVAWSPDGVLLASAGDNGQVGIWRGKDGHLLHMLDPRNQSLPVIAWSPTGSRLLVDDVVWNANTGLKLFHLNRKVHLPKCVQWIQDRIIGGLENGSIGVWDSESGVLLRTLEGHRDWVRAVAANPLDWNLVASAGDDGSLRLWNIRDGRHVNVIPAHADWVRVLSWSPTGRSLASASDDGTAKLWDPFSNTPPEVLRDYAGGDDNFTWSSDGRFAAYAAADGGIRLWDSELRAVARYLEGHVGGATSVSFASDHLELASCALDGAARIWGADSDQPLTEMRGNIHEILCAAISPTTHRVATGSTDGSIKIVDLSTHSVVQTMTGHPTGTHLLAWRSKDGDENQVASTGLGEGNLEIWDVETGQNIQSIGGHDGDLLSIAWSPDGRKLAAGSSDKKIRVWNPLTGALLNRFSGHESEIRSIAWNNDGHYLASGSADKAVRIWQVIDPTLVDVPRTGDGKLQACVATLRGHADCVTCVAWSDGGVMFASGANDGTVRLWRLNSADDVSSVTLAYELQGLKSAIAFIEWGPDSSNVIVGSSDGDVRIWSTETGQGVQLRPPLPFHLKLIGEQIGGMTDVASFQDLTFHNFPILQPGGETFRQVVRISAKVVIAGDSYTGKTSLAVRLATNHFEELPTTIGMQIWKLSPERLRNRAGELGEVNAELFLWDLGGQDEYQLVNQLFLGDTTVALILFDADRGKVAVQSVRGWSAKIDAQAGLGVKKILVSSKDDLRSQASGVGVLRDHDIDTLKSELHVSEFIRASAKREQDPGIEALNRAIDAAIDWTNLIRTSRPESYQAISECIFDLRANGDCVLYLADLRNNLHRRKVLCTDDDLQKIIDLLAQEGQIVSIRLRFGEQILVLRVDLLSRYASAIIQAARANPKSVPALEQNTILSADMMFPGIPDSERIQPRSQEKTVVECVVRLMIERGLCFDYQNLLVFPTMFDDMAPRHGDLPTVAPVSYDFTGPAKNIYAALISRLGISAKFGAVRLWAEYAEFGNSSGGRFGIRRSNANEKERLELYFDQETSVIQRGLFETFVADHLEAEGISVVPSIDFSCRTVECGGMFTADDVSHRLKANKLDIRCNRCDSSYSLFASAEQLQRVNRHSIIALKSELKQKTKAIEQKVASNIEVAQSLDLTQPLRILHLSDLHFTGDIEVDAILQPLREDLQDALLFGRIDYLVVSGDFTHKGNPRGFDKALEFLQKLCQAFEISPLRTILVPGNHDIRHDISQFTPRDWNNGLETLDGHREGNILLVPNDSYPGRFDAYRQFYHSFYLSTPYPISPAQQFQVRIEDNGLVFLALNSAWQIDKYRTARASLNDVALSAALNQSRNVQIGIAIWHHAVTGDRKIKDSAMLERLQRARFNILLHGDVHEEHDDLLFPTSGNPLHVVGAGSFGATGNERPESVPRLYSVLEISRDMDSVRVIRRQQRKPGGPYDAYAIYPSGSLHDRRSDYTIDITKRT